MSWNNPEWILGEISRRRGSPGEISKTKHGKIPGGTPEGIFVCVSASISGGLSARTTERNSSKISPWRNSLSCSFGNLQWNHWKFQDESLEMRISDRINGRVSGWIERFSQGISEGLSKWIPCERVPRRIYKANLVEKSWRIFERIDRGNFGEIS